MDVHDAADATTMLMIPNVCQNAAGDEDDEDDDDDDGNVMMMMKMMMLLLMLGLPPVTSPIFLPRCSVA